MEINRNELQVLEKSILVDMVSDILNAREEEDRRRKLGRQIAKLEAQKKEYRQKETYFTQMQILALRKLELTDTEKALLMVMAPRLSIKTGFVVWAKGKPLNQQDIIKLSGYKSERYVRQVLKSLVTKGVVIEETDGRNTRYKLEPRYFKKGRRKKGVEFVKLYNSKLKALVLETDARALLFTAALYLEYRTNYISIDGKRANCKTLTKLMGWKSKERTKTAIENLTASGILYSIQVSREFNYIVNAECCYKGEDVKDWFINPEIKRIGLSESRYRVVSEPVLKYR